MPRKTEREPSEAPISCPEESSTVGSTPRTLSASGRDTAPSSAGVSLGEDQETPTRTGGLCQSHSPSLSSARRPPDLSLRARFLSGFLGRGGRRGSGGSGRGRGGGRCALLGGGRGSGHDDDDSRRPLTAGPAVGLRKVGKSPFRTECVFEG